MPGFMGGIEAVTGRAKPGWSRPAAQSGVAKEARCPCRVRCAYLPESEWYAQRTLRFGFHVGGVIEST